MESEKTYVAYYDGKAVRLRAITANEALRERWEFWPWELKAVVQKTAEMAINAHNYCAMEVFLDMLPQITAFYAIDGSAYKEKTKNEFFKLLGKEGDTYHADTKRASGL